MSDPTPNPASVRIKHMFQNIIDLADVQPGDILFNANPKSPSTPPCRIVDEEFLKGLRARLDDQDAHGKSIRNILFLREKPASACSAGFLAAYLNTPTRFSDIKNESTLHGAVWQIRSSEVMNFKMSVPPKDVQVQVVDAAKTIQTTIGTLIDLETKKIELLQAASLYLLNVLTAPDVDVKTVLSSLSGTLAVACPKESSPRSIQP